MKDTSPNAPAAATREALREFSAALSASDAGTVAKLTEAGSVTRILAAAWSRARATR